MNPLCWRKLLHIFALLTATVLGFCAFDARAFDWTTARGFNVTPNISRADLGYLAGLGMNVVRVSFADSPLIRRNLPYENNRASFEKLDEIIAAAKIYRLAVIIDPHTSPGFNNPYTTSETDAFWANRMLQDRLNDLWIEIAKRYGHDKDVVLAYDLLNEPVTPRMSDRNGVIDWNQLVRRMVKSIRKYDSIHAIMIEPARHPNIDGAYNSFFEALRDLKLPPDVNIVVSPHMYAPLELTHQGVLPQFRSHVRYPGIIAGVFWDKRHMADVLGRARDFTSATGVPIFIGEFSASVQAGEDGDRYLDDLTEVMNALSFGWAYHAYKENPAWDPQSPSLKRGVSGQSVRMKILLRGRG